MPIQRYLEGFDSLRNQQVASLAPENPRKRHVCGDSLYPDMVDAGSWLTPWPTSGNNLRRSEIPGEQVLSVLLGSTLLFSFYIISTMRFLTFDSMSKSSVYWASPASEGSMTRFQKADKREEAVLEHYWHEWWFWTRSGWWWRWCNYWWTCWCLFQPPDI